MINLFLNLFINFRAILKARDSFKGLIIIIANSMKLKNYLWIKDILFYQHYLPADKECPTFTLSILLWQSSDEYKFRNIVLPILFAILMTSSINLKAFPIKIARIFDFFSMLSKMDSEKKLIYSDQTVKIQKYDLNWMSKKNGIEN